LGFERAKSRKRSSSKSSLEKLSVETVLLYFRYSEGFKSGGFQPTPPATATIAESIFDPEEVKSYELGLKSSWANRVRLNVSAFHVDYTNLQFLAATGTAGGAPVVVITNAASSITDGLELELNAELAPGLGLKLGYSYLDATFDDYVDGAGTDHSGNRVIRTPEHMGHVILQYYLPLGGQKALVLRGEWNGQTEMFFEPANVDRVSQEGFSLFHARIGLDVGPWEAALWGKNLTDETHCQNIIALTANQAGICTVDAPSTWGVTLLRRF
jgi:iron complex outermembrane receptor protein